MPIPQNTHAMPKMWSAPPAHPVAAPVMKPDTSGATIVKTRIRTIYMQAPPGVGVNPV
jgi:hypothetical protein